MIRINKYQSGRNVTTQDSRSVLGQAIRNRTQNNQSIQNKRSMLEQAIRSEIQNNPNSNSRVNKPTTSESRVVRAGMNYKGATQRTKDNLISRTINRDVRERQRENVSIPLINRYKHTAYDTINNTPVKITGVIKGGAADRARGITKRENGKAKEIWINEKFALDPSSNTEKHEFRHAIDFNTQLLPSQQKLLESAYDNDFINIPDVKEEYRKVMPLERVTTNRDARDMLLGEDNMSLEEQDRRIDAASDNEIFNAVRRSNGYGTWYYNYLMRNGKLTPLKAKQFREAMKHVGYNTPTQTSDFNPTYNTDIT